MLHQQRELTAAFSKASRPPWLTLEQLHHMTALVRALRALGHLRLCCGARSTPCRWLRPEQARSGLLLTPPDTSAPHTPASLPEAAHPQLCQPSGRAPPGAGHRHAQPSRGAKCRGQRRRRRRCSGAAGGACGRARRGAVPVVQDGGAAQGRCRTVLVRIPPTGKPGAHCSHRLSSLRRLRPCWLTPCNNQAARRCRQPAAALPMQPSGPAASSCVTWIPAYPFALPTCRSTHPRSSAPSMCPPTPLSTRGGAPTQPTAGMVRPASQRGSGRRAGSRGQGRELSGHGVPGARAIFALGHHLPRQRRSQSLPRSSPCPLAPAVPASAGSWLADLLLLSEYGRIAGLLARLPTSEQQDEALLAGRELAAESSWKQRELVRFRLHRKRALRHALERMEAAWAAAHPTADLRALCGPGSEAGSSGGSCVGHAARLAAQFNLGSAAAALPEALQEPLGAVTLAALQLRRPGVLLGRQDVLLVLACAAAGMFLMRPQRDRSAA